MLLLVKLEGILGGPLNDAPHFTAEETAELTQNLLLFQVLRPDRYFCEIRESDCLNFFPKLCLFMKILVPTKVSCCVGFFFFFGKFILIGG